MIDNNSLAIELFKSLVLFKSLITVIKYVYYAKITDSTKPIILLTYFRKSTTNIHK